MANINISDLGPARTDLFLDSESYINDLTEGEMMNKIVGGFSILGVGGFLFLNYPKPTINNTTSTTNITTVYDIDIHGGSGDITVVIGGG